MHWNWHMKSSALESKPFPKPELPAKPGGENAWAFPNWILIDSYAELFIYLIQGIRFGSWKDRRLERALVTVIKLYFCLIKQFTVCQLNYAKFPTGCVKGALKIFCTKKHYISPTFAVFSINPNPSSRNFIGDDGTLFSKLIKLGWGWTEQRARASWSMLHAKVFIIWWYRICFSTYNKGG